LRNESGTVKGSTTPNSFGGGLAFAKKFGDFGFGVAGKYYQENIDNYSYFAYGFDVGLLWVVEDLKFAAGGRNIGSFSGFNLPENYYGGASYHIGLGPESLLFSTEITISPNQNAIFHGGLEAGYLKTVFLRVGYQTDDYDIGYGNTSGLSVGIGLLYFPFDVDLSITSYGDLGTTLKVSLGYTFGSSQDEQEQKGKNKEKAEQSLN
jgi:hypothetical protein